MTDPEVGELWRSELGICEEVRSLIGKLITERVGYMNATCPFRVQLDEKHEPHLTTTLKNFGIGIEEYEEWLESQH